MSKPSTRFNLKQEGSALVIDALEVESIQVGADASYNADDGEGHIRTIVVKLKSGELLVIDCRTLTGYKDTAGKIPLSVDCTIDGEAIVAEAAGRRLPSPAEVASLLEKALIESAPVETLFPTIKSPTNH